MRPTTVTMALTMMKVGVTNQSALIPAITLLMQATGITDRTWLVMYNYEDDTTVENLKTDYVNWTIDRAKKGF